MKKAGFKQKQIAAEIQAHPSTVGREISRNIDRRGYRPQQAQQRAEQRKPAEARNRILPET